VTIATDQNSWQYAAVAPRLLLIVCSFLPRCKACYWKKSIWSYFNTLSDYQRSTESIYWPRIRS